MGLTFLPYVRGIYIPLQWVSSAELISGIYFVVGVVTSDLWRPAAYEPLYCIWQFELVII